MYDYTDAYAARVSAAMKWKAMTTKQRRRACLTCIATSVSLILAAAFITVPQILWMSGWCGVLESNCVKTIASWQETLLVLSMFCDLLIVVVVPVSLLNIFDSVRTYRKLAR